MDFGTLAVGLGCIPLAHECYHPRTASRPDVSLAFGVWFGLV